MSGLTYLVTNRLNKWLPTTSLVPQPKPSGASTRPFGPVGLPHLSVHRTKEESSRESCWTRSMIWRDLHPAKLLSPPMSGNSFTRIDLASSLFWVALVLLPMTEDAIDARRTSRQLLTSPATVASTYHPSAAVMTKYWKKLWAPSGRLAT